MIPLYGMIVICVAAAIWPHKVMMLRGLPDEDASLVDPGTVPMIRAVALIAIPIFASILFLLSRS